MIPKTIHYCWFGGKPLPALAKKCIASWKKYLPDYEIEEWNESNFDVCQFQYTAEAYNARKYAFVTDFVRLYALFHEGGVYMDTDVEVLKSLDRFLHHPAFSGFEGGGLVPTGIMGSEKNGEWAKWQLSLYDGKHFSLDEGTNVSMISNAMKAEGFIMNNQYQEFKQMFVAYPNEYFCPLISAGHKLHITSNTYCIHHFAGSWLPLPTRIKLKIMRMLPEKISNFLRTAKAKFKNTQ